MATPTKLTWDRNTESDMDHYEVYMNGIKQASVAQVPVGSIPEWLLPPITSGNLTVKAVDKSGNESELSVMVPFDLIAPKAPQNPRLV